ncbi:MAG: peptide/nickel transport system ATP-binding protein ddpF, partial [Actinomycetota bacterium]|nr:peptide/nickel transport system ATP-binding protein ddpF [Actinomycetota bacterium]
MSTLLQVSNLTVSFPHSGATGPVVRNVSFRLETGRALAIVGESGSGKSVIARTLVGLTGAESVVEADRLEILGTDVSLNSERDWRAIRGKDIGFVLQDALVSLDPLRTVGQEIEEALIVHGGRGARGRPERVARQTRVIESLTDAGVPNPQLRVRQRSGELSGGLRQRALIAQALVLHPRVLIADEPTTALDATVQSQIIALLRELKLRDHGLIIISHDLAVVSSIADDVLVLRDGEVVEYGSAHEVLGNPQHPYTRRLLDSVPVASAKGRRLSTAPASAEGAAAAEGAGAATGVGISTGAAPEFLPDLAQPTSLAAPAGLAKPTSPAAPAGRIAPAGLVAPPVVVSAVAPALEAIGLVKSYRGPDRVRRTVVRDVSFRLRAGTTLGIVGESGSGKSTTAWLALGLTDADAGEVLLDGHPWSALPERDRRARRRRIQVVYQDPLSSFDPRHSVSDILIDALRAGESLSRAQRQHRVGELLDSVGLPRRFADRRPLTLSGGQRQRVAIARALAPRPEIIVLDEPVSALDVSIQAQVLDLLAELQERLGLSYLFISHDLGVVYHVSDDVL